MERYSLITETLNSNNAWMILKLPSKLGGFSSLDAAYLLPRIWVYQDF